MTRLSEKYEHNARWFIQAGGDLGFSPSHSMLIVHTPSGQTLLYHKPDNATPRECYGCGACCRNMMVPITPQDDIPKEHVEDGAIKLLPDGRCPFLGDDNLCRIYDRRPRACVSFRRGSSPRCFPDNLCKFWGMVRR